MAKTLGNLLAYLLAAILIVGAVVWMIVFFLGGLEALRWILFGDFFHIF